MKKIICFLLSLFFCTFLCSCVKEEKGEYITEDEKENSSVISQVVEPDRNEAELTKETQIFLGYNYRENINYNYVKQSLDSLYFDECTSPFVKFSDSLLRGGNLGQGYLYSGNYIIAKELENRKINPVEGFGGLKSKGLYERQENAHTDNLVIEFPLSKDSGAKFSINGTKGENTQKEYPFSKEGSKALFGEALKIGECNGCPTLMEYEIKKIMAENDTFSFDEKRKCFYTSFILYNDYIAYLIRAEFLSADKSTITNINFDMVSLSYALKGAAGSSYNMLLYKEKELFQYISFISSFELALTGKTAYAKELDGKLIDRKLIVSKNYKIEGLNIYADILSYKATDWVKKEEPGYGGVDTVNHYTYSLIK